MLSNTWFINEPPTTKRTPRFDGTMNSDLGQHKQVHKPCNYLTNQSSRETPLFGGSRPNSLGRCRIFPHRHRGHLVQLRRPTPRRAHHCSALRLCHRRKTRSGSRVTPWMVRGTSPWFAAPHLSQRTARTNYAAEQMRRVTTTTHYAASGPRLC